LKTSSHRNVVGFELCDDVLSITASAEADSVAKMTDPAAIVFANVEIVVVAKLETGVAELPIAAKLWLLCQSQMAFPVDVRVFLTIDPQQLWNKGLKALSLQFRYF
jgi:hypothetical protein